MQLRGDRKIVFFLSGMTLSLAGNTCAEYALVWLGISVLGHAGARSSAAILVPVFLAQSAAKVFLGPLLAPLVDRHSRRATAVALDSLYIATYLGLLVCIRTGLANAVMLFLTTLATTTIAVLHGSAIPSSVLKEQASSVNLRKYVAAFDSARNLVFVLGALASGLVFRRFGVEACILIGIVTFLPMFPLYLLTFDRTPPAGESGPRPGYLQSLRDGLAFLRSHPELATVSVSLAAVNAVSVIFPAVVGLAFERAYPGHVDYASMAVSATVVLNILLIRFSHQLSGKLSLNTIILASLGPIAAVLIGAAISPGPVVLCLAFLVFCWGSSLRNILSGSLRVACVPNELLGRVNTVYSSLLGLGQLVGSLVVLPLATVSLRSGALAMLALVLFAAAYSWKRLPAVGFPAFLASARR